MVEASNTSTELSPAGIWQSSSHIQGERSAVLPTIPGFGGYTVGNTSTPPSEHGPHYRAGWTCHRIIQSSRLATCHLHFTHVIRVHIKQIPNVIEQCTSYLSSLVVSTFPNGIVDLGYHTVLSNLQFSSHPCIYTTTKQIQIHDLKDHVY